MARRILVDRLLLYRAKAGIVAVTRHLVAGWMVNGSQKRALNESP
jgi:hypothetical protein